MLYSHPTYTSSNTGCISFHYKLTIIGYDGYTEEQDRVGTQRSRVWWVHRGAGYGGYTEEQGMMGTQRSRIGWVHRGAGYGGYIEEQGMVGTQRSRV